MYLGGYWIIEGKEVKCQGNIENLLDYKSVINNINPKMASRCFSHMFCGCTALIETPQFLSNTLSDGCYCMILMFLSYYKGGIINGLYII